MSTGNPTAPAAESAERAVKTVFGAVVFDDTALVMNESFEHAGARRDAVLDLLASNHDEVSQEEIDEILASFGGADADVALSEVVTLFVERGAKVSVSLEEKEVDAGPALLFGVFTVYSAEDHDFSLELYSTAEERRKALEARVSHFYTGADGGELPEGTDAETLVKIIDTQFLLPTRGRARLVEVRKEASADVWRSDLA